MKLSIIIPAKDESKSLKNWLPELCKTYLDAQIIVVDDGSTDNTSDIAKQAGATVVRHPISLGNGAAIKSGVRASSGDTLLFMDGDGQHQIKDIPKLIETFNQGYDMVVGARKAKDQASIWRRLANGFGCWLSSLIVKQRIEDLTSGFRVAKADCFKAFLHLLPNGFSYPTTITMAFFRTGFTVAYKTVDVRNRFGKSHLRPIRDAFKFLIIIYKMTILYSPCKVFIPVSLLHFIAGFANYAYTYHVTGRFTNMSAVLISAGIIIFLIGLISEQITSLMYQQTAQKVNPHD